MVLVHGVFLDLLRDVPDALFGGQLREQAQVVDGFIVNVKVGDAEVMERCEHVVFEGVLQRDAVGDHVVEQAVHVVTVGAARGSRHA